MKYYMVRILCLIATTAVACLTGGALATASFASAPALRIYAESQPNTVSAGESVILQVGVQNVGDETTTGPINVTYAISSGAAHPEEYPYLESEGYTSSRNNVPVGNTSCEANASTFKCVAEESLPPGAQMYITLRLVIGTEATGTLTSSISVSGGGSVGTVTAEHEMTVGLPRPFEFTSGVAQLLSTDGFQDQQAGSDPSEFTTSLHWPSLSSKIYAGSNGERSVVTSVGHFKDVTAHLPPGLIGNPSATAALCTPDELAGSHCPQESQIGVVHLYLTRELTPESLFVGLFNMVAPYGVATELGFQTYGTNILLQAYVRPGDHGVDIVSNDTSTSAPVTGVDITVWGVPSDPSHDRYRESACLDTTYGGANGLTCPASGPRKAFLRLPTSCPGTPLQFGASSNTYEEPEHFVETSFTGPTMTGCEVVPFSPTITVDPTGTSAASPTGVSVKLSLPQNQNPDGLAEADLKKAVVTLPEGMAINPSAADGLQACDDEDLHLDSNTPANCPDGSKIGTVLLHTQLIPNPIEGSIYLRTQNSDDPTSGEMFRIVIELRDDSHGLDFKLTGHISANPVTGRLTTTFDDNPQFPFEDISLSFKSGSRAPLVTPASCQTETTQADLYSWSQPNVPVVRSTSFNLTSGADGTACPPPSPFNPVFEAGVASVQAGGFTPFLTTFKRSDADQAMEGVSVKLPQGLLGSLVGLPLCAEAQAQAGTCTQASEIGTLTAGTGAGPTPFYVTGGKVFMTGPYRGAPFGLSIVVPGKAGPFNLGTVVVRAKVEVDAHTAQLTVVSDPFPQIVLGVPVNLRLVNVTINRPNFTYNPTSCDPSSVSGTMTGSEGAVVALSNHFQVTNCGALGFKPKFSVSTSGKTSRANGASLDAKLSYPKNLGQANIAKVKVALPKQLPSRLTTLQKACLAQVFEANPAGCPSASRIGSAVATTPVLPVPLSGPVYFVSHGGEAFPDLVIVLQGYGVTVDLVGTTFISKAGITSTTFKSVPDVPVGTFELKLPTGRFSALAANGNLCTSKLKMPTAFLAQDGAEIHQTTPIAVTGCPKHKAKKASKSQHKRPSGKSGKRK